MYLVPTNILVTQLVLSLHKESKHIDNKNILIVSSFNKNNFSNKIKSKDKQNVKNKKIDQADFSNAQSNLSTQDNSFEADELEFDLCDVDQGFIKEMLDDPNIYFNNDLNTIKLFLKLDNVHKIIISTYRS